MLIVVVSGVNLLAIAATRADNSDLSNNRLTFERDIRPILKAHCFDCHGEGEKLKGDLDLRLRRLLLKGGESGPAIVPGNPEKSLLFEKVRSGEMPKRDMKLSREHLELIQRWIAAGAKTARDEPVEIAKGMQITPEDRAHWAFQALRCPSVPVLKNNDRVRTPIDAFLWNDLSKHRLTFSADADKVTLLRRAYFDLVGLPPTPDEVAEFIKDHSPDAYERVIDRLLNSPH